MPETGQDTAQANNETVTLRLPSGEEVDAIVPAGMSDEQVSGLMRQKHPEYWEQKQEGQPTQAQPPIPEKTWHGLKGDWNDVISDLHHRYRDNAAQGLPLMLGGGLQSIGEEVPAISGALGKASERIKGALGIAAPPAAAALRNIPVTRVNPASQSGEALQTLRPPQPRPQPAPVERDATRLNIPYAGEEIPAPAGAPVWRDATRQNVPYAGEEMPAEPPAAQPVATPPVATPPAQSWYPPRAATQWPAAGSAEDLAETRNIQEGIRTQAEGETDALRRAGNEEAFARNTRRPTGKGELTQRFKESQGVAAEAPKVKLTKTSPTLRHVNAALRNSLRDLGGSDEPLRNMKAGPYEYRKGDFFKDGRLLETGPEIVDAVAALDMPQGKVIEGETVKPRLAAPSPKGKPVPAESEDLTDTWQKALEDVKKRKRVRAR